MAAPPPAPITVVSAAWNDEAAPAPRPNGSMEIEPKFDITSEKRRKLSPWSRMKLASVSMPARSSSARTAERRISATSAPCEIRRASIRTTSRLLTKLPTAIAPATTPKA